jgi:hypothetical protein
MEFFPPGSDETDYLSNRARLKCPGSRNESEMTGIRLFVLLFSLGNKN